MSSNNLKIGAHFATDKGLIGAVDAAETIGANAIQIFFKSPKTSYLGQFDPFFPKNGETGFFMENRGPSLLTIYHPLTSCKKLEKTNEPIPRKVRY